jgi:hypothetical protein
MVVNGNLHTSYFVAYDIRRKTDSNYKSTSGTLHLVYRPNNIWAVEGGLEVVDLAGVEFTMVSLGGGFAELMYTSDSLGGTSYVATCKMKSLKFGV